MTKTKESSRAEDNERVGMEFFERCATFDWDGARNMMADDFVVTNQLGETFNGDELTERDKWYDAHLKDQTATDAKLQGTDDGFIVEYTVSFIGVNGQRHTMRCCGVFSVREGKLTRYNRYADRVGLAEATEGAPGGVW